MVPTRCVGMGLPSALGLARRRSHSGSTHRFRLGVVRWQPHILLEGCQASFCVFVLIDCHIRSFRNYDLKNHEILKRFIMYPAQSQGLARFDIWHPQWQRKAFGVQAMGMAVVVRCGAVVSAVCLESRGAAVGGNFRSFRRGCTQLGSWPLEAELCWVGAHRMGLVAINREPSV